MSVMHLASVLRFEDCLKHGGTHKFGITADEMPHLESHPHVHAGLQIPCAQARELASEGSTWARIVNDLAKMGAICIYRRTSPGSYEVTCFIPGPDDAERRKQAVAKTAAK